VGRIHIKCHCKAVSLDSQLTSFRYESINTYNKLHAKEEGQLNGMPPLDLSLVFFISYKSCTDSADAEASDEAQQKRLERGEQTAENVRYGEAISEHGFGGE
jgi:hypothetical protein